MKIFLLALSTVIAASAAAQYTKVSSDGFQQSAWKNLGLFFTPPYNPTLTWTEYAFCVQSAGSATEPVPYTFPWERLYDNSWMNTSEANLIEYGPNADVSIWIETLVSSGTETWVKTGESGWFSRYYESEAMVSIYYY